MGLTERRARMVREAPRLFATAAYLAKYGERSDLSSGGAKPMAETYDVPIRIRPTRVVTFD